MKAPVVFIGFNRPSLSARSIGNVAKCDDVSDRDLFLFIDGPRDRHEDDVVKTDETEKEANRLRTEGLSRLKIVRREKNLGCRDNIIAAITEVTNQYGRAIIVEDDVLVSRTFLKYQDAALDFYERDKRIWCINAFRGPIIGVPDSVNGDVYLAPRNMCWGWGVWADRWSAVDFGMKDFEVFCANPRNVAKLEQCDPGLKTALEAEKRKAGTWDLQCTYHMVKNGLWAIEPIHSLTKNCGSGVDGTHSMSENAVITKQKYYNFLPTLRGELEPDENMLRLYKYLCVPRHRYIGGIYRQLLKKLYAMPFVKSHNEPINARTI